jgi:hypothetical protein
VPYGYLSNDVFNAKAQNGPVSWKAIRPGGWKAMRPEDFEAGNNPSHKASDHSSIQACQLPSVQAYLVLLHGFCMRNV